MECIVRYCVIKPKDNPSSFLLVLKWRMAPHCAAAPQTRRRPQVLVWSCIPTRQLTASAASPSCTALTATTTSRPSPCLEIPPFLGNCKSNASLRDVDQVFFPHWDCAQQIYLFHSRHGEDLIVTPFAQVRTLQWNIYQRRHGKSFWPLVVKAGIEVIFFTLFYFFFFF